MKHYFLRPVHSSWLVSALSTGVITGIALAPLFTQFSSISWLILALVLAALTFWKRRFVFILSIIIAGALVGLWRGSEPYMQRQLERTLVNSTIRLSGQVSEDPDIDARGRLTLRLGNLRVEGKSLTGMAWVAVPAYTKIQRSDQIEIHGQAAEGFGGFVLSFYEPDILGIKRPEPGDIALRIRDWFSAGIRKAIDEPAASLGAGYLLGQRRGLPDELDQALLIAGLTHVVVASGYNLTILIRFARRSFAKISKFAALFASSSLVIGFIAVTGMSPSMSRAGVVAGLALIAWYYGRAFHPLVLLPIVAALSLLIHPSYVWGDVGWMLSFAAFGGVMVFAPLMQAYFFGNEPPGVLRQVVGETVSATICTLPILLITFGYISNVAVIANLLVVPFIPLAMILTFIAGVGAIVVPASGVFIGLPAEMLLDYMVGVATTLSGVEWAITDIAIQPWHAVMMYVAIIISCVYLWRATKYDFRSRSIIE